MRRLIVAVFAGLLIVGSVSAQEAPWRLVQSEDGTLYVIAGGNRHRIVPAPISGAELGAIAESQAWEDGNMIVESAAPAVPPVPAPAVPPAQPASGTKRIGETTILTGESGVRIAVTVFSLKDNATSTNQFNKPDGRWVVTEWEIKNEGSTDFRVFRTSFKLQTTDGNLITPGNHAGHPEPDLDTNVLGPGQRSRGYLVYDVPQGKTLASLIYQPIGSRQFVIATLP